SRGCAGRRRRDRPRSGTSSQRRDRWKSTECAKAQTAARGWHRDRGRRGRGPPAKRPERSWHHRLHAVREWIDLKIVIQNLFACGCPPHKRCKFATVGGVLRAEMRLCGPIALTQCCRTAFH